MPRKLAGHARVQGSVHPRPYRKPFGQPHCDIRRVNVFSREAGNKNKSGGLHGLVDIVGGTLSDGSDGLASGRVDDLEWRSAGSADDTCSEG